MKLARARNHITIANESPKTLVNRDLSALIIFIYHLYQLENKLIDLVYGCGVVHFHPKVSISAHNCLAYLFSEK